MFRFWRKGQGEVVEPDPPRETATRLMIREIRARTGIAENSIPDWDLELALRAIGNPSDWTEADRREILGEIIPMLIITHGRQGNAGLTDPGQFLRTVPKR